MNQDNTNLGPYATAAWQYRAAGFMGIIPLGRGPAQKSPPPAGYTGWAGIDPSGPDVQAWVDGREGARNIGWHIPRGYVGVDVDAYHGGAESLQKLEDKVGHVLPATWTSTSRGPGQPTRHHLFRATLPEGRTWRDHPGDGIDSLHIGHRYAMVWPSVNPDFGMAEVCWYDPEGEVYEGWPDPAWFTELDPAWVEELSQEGTPLEGSGATDEETARALDTFRLAPACPRVTRHLAKELDRILKAREGVGSLHDPGALYPLVAYGLEGHAGVREALSAHQAAYVKARVDSRGESEGASDADWWRQVRGAVGKKLHASGGVILTGCDCAQPEEAPEEAAVDPVEALLARMLDRDALDTLKPPTPLIRDLLDLESESWIIGAPGGFKSFVALDWAGHVATGRQWRDRPVTQGRVVYVAAEGKKGIPLRVKAWEAMNGVRMDGVLFLPEPVQVSNATAWSVLVEACRRIGPVLIVLDTQARITVGIDENSNGQMTVLTEAVRRLKEATGACVLVVHHTGRNGEDARGASAIDGAQDTEIKVERPTKKERATLTATISMDKQKDGDESTSFEVQLRVMDLGVDEESGRPLSSLALERWDPFHVPERVEPDWRANLTSNQGEVADAMLEHSDESGATRAQVLVWIKERRARFNVPPMAKTSFDSAARGLVSAGVLTRLGAARLVLSDLVDM